MKKMVRLPTSNDVNEQNQNEDFLSKPRLFAQHNKITCKF